MDRLGQASSVLVSLRATDNVRTGKQSIAEFEGSLADMVSKRTEMIAYGAADVQVHSVGNGYYRCIANFGGGFDGSVTDFPDAPSIHELEVSQLQTSIYRSLILKTLLTPRQIAIVQRIIKDYQAGQYAPTDEDDPLTAEFYAELAVRNTIAKDILANGTQTGRNAAQAKEDAVHLFDLVALEGQEDFIEYSNVYRRTLTAATPDQVRASFEGVGKIWKTNEVRDWEGIDATGFFKLDDDAQWLKARPQVTTTFGQKTQVFYTYTECFKASGLTYEKYKDAVLLYPPSTAT